MQSKNHSIAKFILDELCKRENLRTYGELAERLGVAPSTISTWIVRGKVNADLIYRVLKGLRHTWLLTGEGPMQEMHHVATGGAIATGTADIETHHVPPAHPSGPDPPPPHSPEEDDDKLPTAPQAIEMTREVLASRTIYRGALLQNIKAFHRAVQGEQEMSSMKEKMDEMISRMDAMQAVMERMERRLPVETPAQKRDVQGG